MNNGRFEYCLNVADINASFEFNTKLGFSIVADMRNDGSAIVLNGNACIALFHGHIERNLLNFRGADVFAGAKELQSRGLTLTKDAHTEQDGSAAAEILDPDGNVICLNTFPGE